MEVTRQDLMRFARPVLLAVVGIAIAVMIWMAANNQSAIKQIPVEPTITATLPPPPPPPPPPPTVKPPEPETPTEQPKQVDQPKAPQAPPLTMNGPPQAGGDAFGIGAGSGGGMVVGSGGGEGSGAEGQFAESSYRRLVGSEVERVIQSNDQITSEVFNARVTVWIDPSGKLTRAKVLRSTGDNKLDEAIVEALEHMGALSEPPSPSFRFPWDIEVHGRRGA